MNKKGKTTIATSVPYYVRSFIVEKSENEGESVSEYLRGVLKAFYEINQTMDKLENGD